MPTNWPDEKKRTLHKVHMTNRAKTDWKDRSFKIVMVAMPVIVLLVWLWHLFTTK